ncbi:MAG: outer membrane homotrimeric porin [Desulfovibrio sp.]|uniref:outer membrane homotrimeric porin n=1 Tax=Desulfovibrio sp. 7SRBS1 TaxID=3378064 RepID=UPI003B4226CB
MYMSLKMRLLLVFFMLALVAVSKSAHSVELKTKGELKMNANFWNNMNFTSNPGGIPKNDITTYESSVLWERLRIDFNFIANSNLKAYVQFEIGEFAWGSEEGAFDTDEVAIEVPRSMLQFTWPNTNIDFSVGKFELVVPASSYFTGSAIFDENITAALIAIPITEEVSAVLNYARALDADVAETGKQYDDDFDFVLLSFPITQEGVSVTPFFIYSWLGKNCINRTIEVKTKSASDMAGMLSAVGSQTGRYESSMVHPWWAGASFEANDLLAPFALYFDFNYGHLDDSNSRNDRKGWFTDIAIEYRGWDWFVPSLFFAYGSGMDSDINNGDERMPYLDEDWDAGTSWTGNSPTLKSDLNTHPMGAWYLGAKLAQISFMDKLSHDLIFAYYHGTNHQDMAPYLKYANDLTTEDSVMEVDLYSNYAIFNELTAIVELGVLFPDYDKATWKKSAPAADEQKTAWKVVVGLKYLF